MIKSFKDLWKAHSEWGQGILIKEIKPLKTADIYFGCTPDEWFNFALPKVKKPEELDLKEIKKALSPVSPPTTIYLWEEHIKAGFPKFLSQNGYELMTKDTWVVFDKRAGKNLEIEIPVEHTALAKFPDYEKVAVEVYRKEWSYDNRPYVEVCRRSLTGEVKSKAPSFSAEFFMIYEDSKPVAEGGLFLTKEVGYFHNDATFKRYQRRGYNTALIKKRIKFCLEKGIETLYALVEYEDPSFRNYNKCGFEPWQVANMFVLKPK